MNASIIRSLCFFILLTPLLCNPAAANIYRYTDSNGERHYSNNPSDIPRKYHNTIVVEHEIKYREPEPSPGESAEKKGITDQGNDPGPALVNSFRARERELANEHERLQEEKIELDKAQAEASTPHEILLNNNRVREFNRRLKEYQEKRKALEEEISDYNVRIKENFDESLKKIQEAEKQEAERKDEAPRKE